MYNNSLHADYHKRHNFCKRAAKITPLMVAGEAGVMHENNEVWI